MNIEKIKEIIKNEPKFRSKQVYEMIFQKFIDNWDQASNIPKVLREELKKETPLDINAEIKEASDTKSAKALVSFGDVQVETVLMRHADNRNTVCVSTQAGCKMACSFCLTGKMGFKRNLSAEEIVEQVLVFARYLKKKDDNVTNVVFMGMGEPMDNYEEVMKSIRFLNDKDTFNIGARRISISTVGVADGINKLTTEPLQVNLAVSLHTSDERIRDKIMPVSKMYSLKTLFKSISNYINKTNRKVMIEYLMLAGVNDSEDQARELAEMLKKELESLFVVNLISYNQTGKYKSSDAVHIAKFKKTLESYGIEVIQRYKFGRDIKAACGQLATRDK